MVSMKFFILKRFLVKKNYTSNIRAKPDLIPNQLTKGRLAFPMDSKHKKRMPFDIPSE